MKIGVLITARLKSSRLPLKLLLDLKGRTIVERVIDRCKGVSNIDSIVLCTSTNSQDRPLVDLALSNDIYYYLGSEEDVLQRLADTANFFDLDYIISITGENPLFSIHHANLVVNNIKTNRPDFVMVNGLPIGCAVYGLNVKALKVVCEIKKEIDTEIWGPLINRPELFNVQEIEVAAPYQWPELRLTSDYQEDYLLLNRIYSDFNEDITPNLLEVLDYLRSNREVVAINSERKQASLSKDVIDRIDSFYSTEYSKVLELKKSIYDKH